MSDTLDSVRELSKKWDDLHREIREFDSCVMSLEMTAEGEQPPGKWSKAPPPGKWSKAPPTGKWSKAPPTGKWSKAPPTEPGLWFWRDNIEAQPIAKRVHRNGFVWWGLSLLPPTKRGEWWTTPIEEPPR